MKTIVILTFFSLFGMAAKCAPVSDLVTSLPGINFLPNFKHYSGFLRGSNTHILHYWFTLSQNNPAKVPVILWLSGGPGCSSVGDLLFELGPFHIKNNGSTVYEHVFAWNKIANVIFLESPAGVGYSYSTDGNITTNDDLTAKENYNALLDFFINKFPEFRSNDFYIGGVSYGGVYVPTLSVLVLQDAANFPTFKGVALSNPLLSYKYNLNALMPYLYNHGIISAKTWEWFGSTCCNGNPNTCNYYDMPHSGQCYQKVLQVLSIIRNFQHYNPYSLYTTCYIPSNSLLEKSPRAFAPTKLEFITRTILMHYGMKFEDVEQIKTNSKLPFCAQKCTIFPPGLDITANAYDAGALPACADFWHEAQTNLYMNRADVRKALHIPTNLPSWAGCSLALATKYYHTQYTDMSPQINQIINAGKKVLVFTGDTDAVCNVMGHQVFVSKLGTPLVQDKTLWTYTHDIPDAAGFMTRYQGIDFTTIRGAGHVVTMSRPREGLQMIANFIWNRPYSTPTNISVVPQPLVGKFCSQLVLSPSYFAGPVVASSLCGQGTCVNSGNGAMCMCSAGFSGKFCNNYTPMSKTVQIQLCAAYPTPQTTAAGLPFGCPQTYTCVPYQYKCVTTLTCNYPIGYCLPWVHINTMFPSMRRKLKLIERLTSKKKIVSHYAK